MHDIEFKLNAPEPAEVLSASRREQATSRPRSTATIRRRKDSSAEEGKLAELRANGGQIAKPKEADSQSGRLCACRRARFCARA